VLENSCMNTDLPSLESKIDVVQGVQYIEYMMEDIRVTFRKDVKATVGGLSLDAKEGDISSIPRWMAKILIQHEDIQIQDHDIPTYISRAFNRERIAKPHDLSNLDSDFYVRVNDYSEGLREREKENILVSLNSFVSSRLEKIVKLAAASPLSAQLKEKLSTEECELYSLIHDSSVLFKNRVIKNLG
jgi:DNA replication factor GINS